MCASFVLLYIFYSLDCVSSSDLLCICVPFCCDDLLTPKSVDRLKEPSFYIVKLLPIIVIVTKRYLLNKCLGVPLLKKLFCFTSLGLPGPS
jgi:hypothetical protein